MNSRGLEICSRDLLQDRYSCINTQTRRLFEKKIVLYFGFGKGGFRSTMAAKTSICFLGLISRHFVKTPGLKEDFTLQGREWVNVRRRAI